jgi:cytoskeleton protein RodZ
MTEPEAGFTAPESAPDPVPDPASDPAAIADNAVQQPQTAGGMLQHIRESAGLSRADVAGKLKFSVKQIETLESDNYAALGGPTFVRGLVRTYAKLLGAETGPILAALDPRELPPETGQVAADRKGIPFPTAAHTVNPVLRYVVISLAVIAAGILLLYLWHGEELLNGPMVSLPAKRPASAPTAGAGANPAPTPTSTTVNLNPTLIDAPAAQTPAQAPVPPPAPAAIERNAPAGSAKPQAAEKPAEKTAAKAGDKPADKASDKATAKIADKATAKSADKTTEQLAAKPATFVTGNGGGSGRRILMAFARDSWVEVKDANGRTLFSQLNLAGTQQVIEGRAPFELVIGNAAYVTLHYREAPVDLKPYTKAEVARLNLN